jgi:hypothetical protein
MDDIDDLKKQFGLLKALFVVNMIHAYPDKSHDVITKAIGDAIDCTELANIVAVDVRDLFDFVRGAIKDALETDDNIDQQAHLWSDSAYRTINCLEKLLNTTQVTKIVTYGENLT